MHRDRVGPEGHDLLEFGEALVDAGPGASAPWRAGESRLRRSAAARARARTSACASAYWPPRNSVSAADVAHARPIGFELERRLGRVRSARCAHALSLVCTYIAHCASARPAWAMANFGVGFERAFSNSFSAACMLPVRSRRSRSARPFQYAICAGPLLVIGRRRLGALAGRRLIGDRVAQQGGQPLLQLEQIAGRAFNGFAPRHRGVGPLEIQRHAQPIGDRREPSRSTR